MVSNNLASVKRGPLKSLMSINMPECKEMSWVTLMLSGRRLLYVVRKSLDEYSSSKIAMMSSTKRLYRVGGVKRGSRWQVVKHSISSIER